jgi:biotin-(acetyl-CoA carboxylase) ligase
MLNSYLQDGANDKVTIVAKRQTFARSKSQKTYYSMPASQGCFLKGLL